MLTTFCNWARRFVEACMMGPGSVKIANLG
jgi:hypothetical protein